MRAWGSLLPLLLASVAAADGEGTEETEAPSGEQARPNLWDKTDAIDDESFIDDLLRGEGTPLEPGPGPWDLHPLETPVVAGPWRVDRPGSAPTHVDRDGSAREPPPPTARWGPTPSVDGEIESNDPWADRDGGLPAVSRTGPLSNNFPVRILGHEPDALLVELPLLVTESPDDFEEPGFWLIVEIFADRKKVGDQRQLFTQSTIATMGPTHAWVKALVPIPAPQGRLELRVSKLGADGRTVEPLFTTDVRYGR
jgi:hypothetical protein